MSTHTRSTWPTWISSQETVRNLTSNSPVKTRIKRSQPRKVLQKRTICLRRSLWRMRLKICGFHRWERNKSNFRHLCLRKSVSNIISSRSNWIATTQTVLRLKGMLIRIWRVVAELRRLKSRLMELSRKCRGIQWVTQETIRIKSLTFTICTSTTSNNRRKSCVIRIMEVIC
jgi:hypothetical protein